MAFADRPALRWQNKVPFEIDSNFSTTEQATINNAVSDWNNDIPFLPFEARNGEDDYVLFEPSDEGCRSAVGRQGGKQSISCDLTTFSKGNILHEMGHAVGLRHEHQRPDRNEFVTIDFSIIDDDSRHNYQIDPTGYLLTEYELNSIMHYGQSAEIAYPGPNQWQRNGLTALDIEGIRRLYTAPHFAGAWDHGLIRVAWYGLWGEVWEGEHRVGRPNYGGRHGTVSMDSRGRTVVVWREQSRLYAQGFEQDASTVFDAIELVSGLDGGAHDMATYANTFWVVWLIGGQVRGREFDFDGQPIGPQTTYYDGADGPALAVGCAANPNAQRVTFTVQTSTGHDVRLIVIGHQNVTLATGLQTVGTPRVDVNIAGLTAVTWSHQRERIMTTLINHDGSVALPTRQVWSGGRPRQTTPDVAIRDDGRFVVVWTNHRTSWQLGQIHMRGFEANGPQWLPRTTVNTQGGGDQRRPRVDISSDNQILVVWQTDAERDDQYQIHGAIYDENGQTLVNPVFLHQQYRGDQRHGVGAFRTQ